MNLIRKNDENTREHYQKYDTAKRLKRELMTDLIKMKIRPKYFRGQNGYPPKMLDPMEGLINKQIGNEYDITSNYPVDVFLSTETKKYIKERYLR